MDSSDEELVILSAACNQLLKMKKRQLQRNKMRTARFWVNPYLQERNAKGRFSKDFEDLKANPNQFAENFHMDVPTFEAIFAMVLPHLMPKRCSRPDVIDPQLKFAVVLEFLASGTLPRHMASIYRISKARMGVLIDVVCKALYTVLKSYISPMTKQDLLDVSNKYFKVWNFPNCLGAMDGKHVPLRAPSKSGSMFYNYKTDEIPEPRDVNEEELTEILQSEDVGSFRVPMSISDPRITKDKSNNPVDVCDIAVNSKFFVKCQKSTLFKEFFLAIISEALSEKYNVQLRIDKAIVLNNRKFIGTLVPHRVRNADVKSALFNSNYENLSQTERDTLKSLKEANNPSGTSGKLLVQEISDKEVSKIKELSNALGETNASKIKKEISQAASHLPEFKLRAKFRNEHVDEIQAEFYLPKCVSSNEITLDIGEDRILLESMKHGYLFDKFVNYRLKQELAKAIFDKVNKMLQVRIPIHPGN